MSGQWLLKIFSGPHIGAEMLLDQGELILGRDDDCDVILEDALIAPRHVKLSVEDDAVRCDPLNGEPVYVDGDPFTGGALEQFQYLTLGSTHMAVGPTDEYWPTQPLPELRRDKQPDADQDSADAEGATSEANAAEPADSAATSSRRWPHDYWIPIAIVVGILLLLSPALYVLMAGRSETAPVTAAEPLDQQIWKVIRSHEIESNIQVVEGRQGWTVEGYVATSKDREALQNELRQLLPAAAIRLWDSEGLASAAAAVLAAMRVPLNAVPGSPGEVIVEGRMSDHESWQKAQQRILKDVSAIQKLTDQVEFPGQEDEQQPATNVVESSREADAVLAVVKSRSRMAAMPMVKLRSVSIGADRVVVLEDGRRVMTNGRIDNWMLTAIEQDRLVLQRGAETYVLDLTAP